MKKATIEELEDQVNYLEKLIWAVGEVVGVNFIRQYDGAGHFKVFIKSHPSGPSTAEKLAVLLDHLGLEVEPNPAPETPRPAYVITRAKVKP